VCLFYVLKFMLAFHLTSLVNIEAKKTTKLRSLGPRANYTDRATKLVSTFAVRGCCVNSATNSHSH
jgi:hypothetical protein